MILENQEKYYIYDWSGKVKWMFLMGCFLVDPRYEQEFIAAHETATKQRGLE